MELPSENSFIRKVFVDHKPLHFIWILAVLTLLSVGIWLALDNDAGLPVLGGVVGIAVVALCFFYPKIWLYLTIVCFTFFFLSSSQGVSTLDVLTGVFYLGGLVAWFIIKVAVYRQKIVRNTADWMILFFFVFMLGNSCVAMFHGVTFFDWFREYALFILTLYYFPFREYFSEKKDIHRLLIVLGATIVLVDLGQFYLYYKLLSQGIMYAYQIGNTSKINQSIFTVISLAGMIFYFYSKKTWEKIFVLICTLVTIVALGTTFSRTFWVLLIFETGLIYFYMSKRDKARLIKFVGILLVIIISAMFLFLKDYTKIVFQIIEKRFTSTTEGTSDVSVRARFVEYNAAWHLIEQYPMGGNGLAKWFIHYDPLDEITVLTPLIHNGYIYLVYRLGFPLTIFYMVVVFYYLVKAEKYARKIKDPLYKSLALTSFLWLVMMVLANMSSAQFVYRDGIFVMALAYAFVGICEKKYEEELQLLLPELHDGQTKLD